MKKLLFFFSFFPSVVLAYPRHPNPKNPDQTWQDILDVNNATTLLNRRFNTLGYINVKDPEYGAKCDNGVTDDYLSLYKAIQAAEQRPWSKMLIPSGGCRTTQTLWVSSSTAWEGIGPVPESNSGNLFTGAGAANTFSGYPAIYFDIANSTGLLVQQASVGYAAQFDVSNLMFICKDQASGTGAHGIVVQSADYASGTPGAISFQQEWNNVTITNCGGRDVWLKEGYYGSHFSHVRPWTSGLGGFVAEGTSQGEWSMFDFRGLGNGAYASVDKDLGSFYIDGGGSSILWDRVSASGYKNHGFIDGVQMIMTNFQGETLGAGNIAGTSGLIVKNCHPILTGLTLSLADNFIGKNLDFRGVTNAVVTGYQCPKQPGVGGYHVYEDASSGSNIILSGGGLLGGTTNNFLQTGSKFGFGTDFYFNNDIMTGITTFPSGSLSAPPIIFGTTNATTTGIASLGTNRVDIVNAGRNNGTFDYPGATIAFTTGSVSALPILFQNTNYSGQANVGVYNSAPNCEALTTNSSVRLEICNSSITAKAGTGFYGDGTNLTGVSAGTFSGNYVASVATNASMKGGAAAGNAVAISLSVDCASGTCQGNTFNGASQLTQTDSNGGLNLSLSTFTTLNTGRIRSSGTDWITFSSTGTAIKGCTTGIAAAAGMYGQPISSITAAFTPMPTSNTWGDVASIVLTTGCYKLSGSVEETANGATDSDYQCGYGLTAGNTAPAAPSGSATAFGLTRFNPSTGAASADAPCMLPSYPVCVTVNTTYYFKILGVFTVATPKYSGGIYAVRSN